jgi:squalene synthase HpnC
MNTPASTSIPAHHRPADHVDPGFDTTNSTIADSFAACRHLANTHYENFSVLTRLVPIQYRDSFAALYAFCRTADDAADENSSPGTALADLARLHDLVDAAATRPPDTLAAPLFPAIAHTMQSRNLPADLFHRLLTAFERDQTQNRYDTLDDVIDYCKGSADPVGRLVLLITDHAGHSELETLFKHSDATCTALQLANHWQDVARDYEERDRIYLPLDILRKHRLTESLLITDVKRRCASPAFKSALRDLCNRTQPMFADGRKLWPMLNKNIRPTIQLFTLGGESVLNAIASIDYDVLRARPKISKRRKENLLIRAWIAHKTGINCLPKA